MNFLTPDKSIQTFDLLAPYGNLVQFTTTRKGGVSKGDYAELNCGTGTRDKAANVQKNLEILCGNLHITPDCLVIPEQVHKTKVTALKDTFVKASKAKRKSMLKGVDAMVTDKPNICLCIATADCLPLMFYDTKNRAIGMAHAGWRGSVNKIALKTLERMAKEYGTKGEDTIACIGPGISQAAFEVGDEVYEQFRDAGFPMDSISEWKRNSHKYHINLWLANKLQMQEFGIPSKQIELSAICTYLRYRDYFSARRLGADCGRMLTGIMLKDEEGA